MTCHRCPTAALAPTVGASVYEPHDAPHQSPHPLACRSASKPTPETHMSLAIDQVALLKDAYRKVPLGGLVLTAGVDLQHDRAEVHLIATGRGQRRYVVDYIPWLTDGLPNQHQRHT
ncbi:phage terminase large subunit family protein [Xylella fastidiosa]|uniref:Phage terminase large subunit family protein n=2 Tax=Xylella fastidiosa TaxID=2371 RepID=A0ABD7BY70_XYLFS|nr:phage terminase large subunit family protein [Xylella fastidiosa]